MAKKYMVWGNDRVFKTKFGRDLYVFHRNLMHRLGFSNSETLIDILEKNTSKGSGSDETTSVRPGSVETSEQRRTAK